MMLLANGRHTHAQSVENRVKATKGDSAEQLQLHSKISLNKQRTMSFVKLRGNENEDSCVCNPMIRNEGQ